MATVPKPQNFERLAQECRNIPGNAFEHLLHPSTCSICCICAYFDLHVQQRLSGGSLNPDMADEKLDSTPQNDDDERLWLTFE